MDTIDETMITKDFDVDLIVNYPGYDLIRANNDISLVRLAETADLTIYTPICLPETNQDFTGQLATLTG